MRNDPLGIAPAAIVQESKKEYSLDDLAKKIKPLLRKQARTAREIGEYMELLFARVKGWARKDFLSKHFGITERHAYRYLRMHREWAAIKENTPDEPSEGFSLDKAMTILEEDTPEEGGKDVPFAPAGSPVKPSPATQPTPDREPGDDTESELLATKIEAILCCRCKRIGQASCDQCRVKAFKITQGMRLNVPPAPKKPTPKNGQPILLWPDFYKEFGHIVQAVNQVANAGEVRYMGNAQTLKDALIGWLKEFVAYYEEVTGQKAPKISPSC